MDVFRIETVVFLTFGILLRPTFGFVHPDTGAQPVEKENPTKGYLQNVSLLHLNSNYIKQVYPDVSFLKISNSKIVKIDKYAFDFLSHLNLIDLSNNDIQEPMDPETFSRLSGLEILILRNLRLRTVNLNLTNVQELILSGNELETFNGGSITGKSLNFIDLSNNKMKFLTGNFSHLNKLSMVDLSKNKIDQVSEVFEDNVNLLRILASENRIASTEGLRLPWLKTLDLFANKIAILNQESFSGMTSLEELVLAFNDVGRVEDAFKDLTELKFLNLAWNRIEELRAELFRNNQYLTKLSLQGNNIRSLEKFQNVLYHLRYLDLSHNQLSRLDEKFFHSTPSLEVLDLSFNRLSTLEDVLAPLKELKVLNLAYNNIALEGDELSGNGELTRVNLSSNGLRSDVSAFKHNQLLKELDLRGNNILDFCSGDVVLKGLMKINLAENAIQNLGCLRDFKSLCEVDLRKNPLICGEEFDSLMLSLAEGKSSPFKLAPEFQTDVLHDQCENLSLTQSFALWNSIKSELCPKEQDPLIDTRKNEEWESEEEEGDAKEPDVERFESPGPIVVVPLGEIKNDEMHKPNPLQVPQSERGSWEKIEENAELVKELENEELGKKPRFSWYTIALILIGLSLTLTCFNLVVFLYIRMKVWKRTDTSSPQKYTILHNEVYKNTTEPTKTFPIGDPEWNPKNQTKNKMFTYGKMNEFLLNFGISHRDKDSESAKNVLIHPTTNRPENC